MKVIIIAGFLGAGKTSIIQFIAGYFSAANMKIAVIENDVSPVGTDANYLAQQGLIVKELAAGCICCRLKGNLLNALKQLQEEHAPDLVIIEPTGAAAPGKLKDVLSNETLCTTLLTTLVVDLQRSYKLGTGRYPFLDQSIRMADAIILNKTDSIDLRSLNKVKADVIRLNPQAICLAVSVKNNHNLNRLPWLFQQEPITRQVVTSQYPDHNHTDIPAHAAVKFYFHEMSDAKEIIAAVRSLIEKLLQLLHENGCTLIGHIKAFISDSDGNYAFLSTTGFNLPIEQGGTLTSNKFSVHDIILNVIVYGILQNSLKELVNQILISHAFCNISP